MPPESRARSEALAEKLLSEMPLHDLRHARGLSQEALARRLNVKQPSIAKLEQRTDMYISTLRDHIRALGGELEIIARFSRARRENHQLRATERARRRARAG
jgi:transcriptional regulator with XRE-family HTH domain